jgi:hypothetical protein
LRTQAYDREIAETSKLLDGHINFDLAFNIVGSRFLTPEEMMDEISLKIYRNKVGKRQESNH